MSDNTQGNLVNKEPDQLHRTLRRHELIDHLNNFNRDINRYIHVMPGVVLGVPCSDVIQAAIQLNYYISILKGNLIETMLREGLSPVRDSEAISGRLDIQPNYCTSTPIRGYHPQQRVQGHIPPMMENYLEAISLRDPNATYIVQGPPNPRDPHATYTVQGPSSNNQPLSSPAYQNILGAFESATPPRPPRSIDGSQALTPPRPPRSYSAGLSLNNLDQGTQSQSNVLGVAHQSTNNNSFVTAFSTLQCSDVNRQQIRSRSVSQYPNSPRTTSDPSQTNTPGNPSSLARPFM